MEDGQTAVNHEKGTVMLLNFWHTSSASCQGPMAHNQEMLTKNVQDWGSNVRIVCLSIDESTTDVKERVEYKAWDKIEHY